MPIQTAQQAISNEMGPNISPFGFRNRVQNGEININQRAVANTTASASSLNANFYIDRWSSIHYNSGGAFNPNISVKQTSDHPIKGSNGYCLEIQCNTTGTTGNTTDFFSSTHNFEAQNIADIFSGTNAQPMTLSFWVKSNKTGTYCIQLRDNSGTGAYISIYEYTIVQSGVWEKKTISIPKPSYSVMPMNNSNGLTLYFHYASGVTPTYVGNISNAINNWYPYSSSGVATNNQTNLFTAAGNYHRLTDVQLEVGNVATPFERKPYARELQDCQRYLYRMADDGGNNIACLPLMITYSSTRVFGPATVPVPLRAAPSITISNVYSWTGGGFGTAPLWTSLAVYDTMSSPGSCTLYLEANAASGFTGIVLPYFQNGANAFINFSAEI
jgi:hypothetical protein